MLCGLCKFSPRQAGHDGRLAFLISGEGQESAASLDVYFSLVFGNTSLGYGNTIVIRHQEAAPENSVLLWQCLCCIPRGPSHYIINVTGLTHASNGGE